MNNNEQSLNNEFYVDENGIDGQQMFEMINVLANSLATVQNVLARMMEVQDKQTESILSISNNIEHLAKEIKELKQKQQ